MKIMFALILAFILSGCYDHHGHSYDAGYERGYQAGQEKELWSCNARLEGFLKQIDKIKKEVEKK